MLRPACNLLCVIHLAGRRPVALPPPSDSLVLQAACRHACAQWPHADTRMHNGRTRRFLQLQTASESGEPSTGGAALQASATQSTLACLRKKVQDEKVCSKIVFDEFLACFLLENVKVTVSFLCFPRCCMQTSHQKLF